VEFRRYEKIARLGTTDTEGILDGTVYVAPKLDGTNGSVWRQGATIYFGSRSRRLGEGDDNAGFKTANKDDPRLHKILDEHPNWRLYGEWLVPHTIRGYKKDAWRKFYIYDVYDGERFLKPDEWMEDISSAGLDYIFHSSLYKPTMEEVEAIRTLLSSKYMKEGEVGEGIVLKNFSFINKYGEKKYAKYINEFFHNRPKKEKLVHLTEDEIATEVTKELVDKTVAKILVAEDTDRWDRKTMIPRLIETVYHDVITEKLYDKLKKLKLPTVNFKLLKWSISRAIRENGEEYF